MIPNLTQQLQETIQHHYEHAPSFRQRMEAANLRPEDIQTVDDLAKLPVLRKDDVVALQRQHPPFGGLLAAPITEIKRIYQSPGPIHEPEPRSRDAGGWAIAMRAAGFQPGDIVMNALGYHMTPAGAAMEEALVEAGCIVIPGGIGNQEQQIQMMSTLKVSGYAGLPSYLKVLLGKAKALGVTLYVNRAFCIAEPLPPSLQQEFEAQGIEVYQGYGTAETGNLGYESAEKKGWHLPTDKLIQICDPATGTPLPHGQQGEVVVTLLNKFYAIIRFGVGDLSVMLDIPSPAGHNNLRLDGWQGRVGTATKVRGMFLYPSQLVNLMAARFPEISAYQAIITRENHRDELTLQIELREGTDAEAITERLVTTARHAIKFRVAVDIVPTGTIPADAPPIHDERNWE